MIMGVFVPALIFHYKPLLHFGWHWSRPDQLWLKTTLLTSMVIAVLVLLPLPKGRMIWRTLIIFIYVALQYSNLENYMALGGIADLSLAAHFMDPAFLRGSGLNISHPWIYLFANVMAASGLVLSRSAMVSSKSWIKIFSVSVIFLMGGLAHLPEHSEYGLWRQRDPIFHALSRTSLAWHVAKWTGAAPASATGASKEQGEAERLDSWRQAVVSQLSPDDQARVERMFANEEAKTFRVSPHPHSNVLLIVVEGLSNGYFQDDRSVPYFDSTRHLKKLEAWLKSNAHLRYQNFFAQNRQTHRGQFSMLCGEFHNMASQRSKFEEVVEGFYDSSRCLPHQLAQSGYRTSYLQAGDLQFHQTDVFMSAVGFESVKGLESFNERETSSGWGVDDGTLLRAGAKELSRLSEQDQPWLLMVQTIGTHHPYPVPESFRKESGLSGDQAAFAYLDHELTEFLQSLVDSGALQNTLVMITSDESSGLPDTGEQISFISQSWIPFIVMGAGVEGGQVDQRFLQADVPKSVAWFTGLSAEKLPSMGRNFFAQYDAPRDFAFGNRYLMRVGMQLAEGRTVTCPYDVSDCLEYETGDKFPFVDRKIGEATTVQKSLLQNFLTRNEAPERGLEILDADSTFRQRTFYALNRDRATEYMRDVRIKVHAGQKRCVKFPLTVVKGEVELYLEARGNGVDVPRSELKRLKAGEMTEVGFCVDGGTGGEVVEVELFIRNLGEGVGVVGQ